MRKFKNDMVEGEVYIISQFGVGQNASNFRATHQDYRIMFRLSTLLAKQADDNEIPGYGIHITPASSIYDKDTNLNYLIGMSIYDTRTHIHNIRCFIT